MEKMLVDSPCIQGLLDQLRTRIYKPCQGIYSLLLFPFEHQILMPCVPLVIWDFLGLFLPLVYAKLEKCLVWSWNILFFKLALRKEEKCFCIVNSLPVLLIIPWHSVWC